MGFVILQMEYLESITHQYRHPVVIKGWRNVLRYLNLAREKEEGTNSCEEEEEIASACSCGLENWNANVRST